jgi:hypothetical protein
MTYGFRPDNWPVFESELQARGIATADIERVEIRPADGAEDITVTLRSGRTESWRQPREEA